jgi:RNA polymerase sigma factor (sigma-70 family)
MTMAQEDQTLGKLPHNVAPDTLEAPADGFEALIRPLYEVALRLAFAMLQDRGEAEDAVQDSALRAWRGFDRLEVGSDGRPWFLTIVANRCRSRRRSSWRQMEHVSEQHVSGEWPGAAGERSDLHRAIRALDPTTRLVVVLRYYLDLPFDEVAAVSGLSVTAARARSSRAVARLRTELGVMGVPA